jgi:hypothetical protein
MPARNTEPFAPTMRLNAGHRITNFKKAARSTMRLHRRARVTTGPIVSLLGLIAGVAMSCLANTPAPPDKIAMGTGHWKMDVHVKDTA